MKKEKPWNTIQIVSVCILCAMCGFNFGMRVHADQPTIEFKKGVLDYDEGIGLTLFGGYYPQQNHIVVSLADNDLENTVLHEYGHHIYETLNKEDRNQWDNELCDKTKKIEGYKDSELCNEWFARKFAVYTQGNYNIPEKEFMGKIHAYYLR